MGYWRTLAVGISLMVVTGVSALRALERVHATAMIASAILNASLWVRRNERQS